MVMNIKALHLIDGANLELTFVSYIVNLIKKFSSKPTVIPLNFT